MIAGNSTILISDFSMEKKLEIRFFLTKSPRDVIIEAQPKVDRLHGPDLSLDNTEIRLPNI